MKPITLFVLACLFSACAGNSGQKPADVVSLKDSDATFLALKDTAQKHLPQFIDSLKNYTPDRVFVVKTDFTEGKNHEHMWSMIMNYRDGKFGGVLVDDPYLIHNIKANDTVLLDKAKVEDWVIYNEKRVALAGGFSIQYLKDHQH